ncbi:MAG: hypothetical protein M3Q71_05675 [Chloroflexota bacterium]|nr:hypothetical protein [Chloroflexota bacterium]
MPHEGDLPQEAEWETVWLDDRPLPVRGPVNYQNLATFQQKLTIGDYTKDSDERLSSWVISDLTGGDQLEQANVGTDLQRGWIGTITKRYPGQFTLPLEITAVGGPNTSQAFPLGDLGGFFWAAWGTDLRRWGGAAKAFSATSFATLAAPPVGKAIEFDGLLWIPQGSAGFQKFNGTGIVAAATGDAAITPIAFVEWDQKLIALEHDGQLSVWDGAAWTSHANTKLRSSQPRGLVLYRNRQDERTVFVSTDRDLYAYDAAIPMLYRTDLEFPPHHDRGLGFTVWQNDLYQSVGTGAFRYNGGTISAVGLDRNHGLPARLRGAIRDFEPEHNGVYALVRGRETTTDADPVFALDETSVYDDPLYFNATEAISSLHLFTGIGWHLIWEAPVATTATAWARMSIAENEYTLWWGDGATLYRLPLSEDFHNPEQGLRAGIDRFAPYAYQEMPRFDAGMEGYTKAASHLILRVTECDPACSIRVLYRLNGTREWRTLGETKRPGRTTLPFGATGMGQAFNDTQLRFEFRTSDPTKTPVLRAAILKFTKEPEPGGSWTFNVPLQFGEWMGRSPEEVAADLDALTAPAGERPAPFLRFVHGRNTYRVRVTFVTGPDAAGPEGVVARQVNVVELPTRSDADG